MLIIKTLNKQTLNKLLNRDIFLDAKKCVKYGLAHYIE